MKPKYLALDDQLYGYVCECRSNAQDPILAAVRRDTEGLGDESRMQISQEQGAFMSLLVAAVGARSALEVGTFTGYSSICIARGLAEGGRLICVDASEEWTEIARRHWKQAGLEDRIELRLGDAIEVMSHLEPGLEFDFVFIDAEKTEYERYYEIVLPRVRVNGLILFDNMLWGGRVGRGAVDEASGRAIDELNRKLATDGRVESVLLPVADGIQVCRKR